jgi:hypothetical protein
MKSNPDAPTLVEPPDFSLILGGPLYQLLRRTHLSGDVLELVTRRVIVLVLITWLPLLVLSVVEGHAWGESVELPFFFDVDVQARFLLALSLLIFAELIVHQRMRPRGGSVFEARPGARRSAREVRRGSPCFVSCSAWRMRRRPTIVESWL